MPQISENFSSLVDLDPVLSEIFYQHYDREMGSGLSLFNVLTSNKEKETDLRIGGFRDPVEFEGQIQYQTALGDYAITYTHKEYASGFMVERKLFDDMKYGPIFGMASDMAVAFARKRKKDRASVFNSAFATVTGYDAVVLCSDSHPRSASDSTAVDNLAALTLNSANLETAIVAHRALGDDLGEIITIVPDLLVVPTALRRTALELVGSELTPENANNAINVHQGMQVLVWPELTDTNAWFLVDSTMARRFLKWYDRIPVEFAAEQSFDTMLRKYRGYMRYSFGWSDFRWIYGSNPS
jgi:phage major head subunit gpT-like protein